MVTEIADENLAAFDDYLRYGTDEEASKSDRTRQTYLYTVGRFLAFLEDRQPDAVLARQWIKSLEETGNGATAINRHIWALKAYFRFLRSMAPEEDKAKLDLRMRGLKTKEYLPQVPSDREWDRLLKIASEPIYDPEAAPFARLRAKLELALLYVYGGAGLRLSEATNLKEEDIIDEGYIRVMRKGGREGFVPIEEEPLRGIKDYVSSRGPNGPYLFPGKAKDTAMAPRTAQAIVKSLCRRAGLPQLHVHSLRHMVGYQLRKLDASERDIQELLGHRSITTTGIYTRLRDRDLKRKLPKRFKHARQGRFDWK